MAIYVYTIATGALYSYSPGDTDPVADAATLAAAGLAVVTGLPQQGPTVVWNAATKTTQTIVAPPVPQPILTGIWIMRFTPQEFQAIAASTDATVQQFLYALNHTTQIDLTTQPIINGVGYLLSLNLLTLARIAAIMAVPASVNGP
jgi:hypothetical protein